MACTPPAEEELGAADEQALTEGRVLTIGTCVVKSAPRDVADIVPSPPDPFAGSTVTAPRILSRIKLTARIGSADRPERFVEALEASIQRGAESGKLRFELDPAQRAVISDRPDALSIRFLAKGTPRLEIGPAEKPRKVLDTVVIVDEKKDDRIAVFLGKAKELVAVGANCMFNPRAVQVLQHPDCVEELFHADGTPRVEPVSSKSKCSPPTDQDDSDDARNPLPTDDAGAAETPDATSPVEREAGATAGPTGSKKSGEAEPSEEVELPEEEASDTPASGDGAADPSAKTTAKKKSASASGCSLLAGEAGDAGAPLVAIVGIALLAATRHRRSRSKA